MVSSNAEDGKEELTVMMSSNTQNGKQDVTVLYSIKFTNGLKFLILESGCFKQKGCVL